MLTKAKRRQVMDALSSAADGYGRVGTYLYGRMFCLVLNGFSIEFASTGVYVWRWRFPLFDRFAIIHLGFSDRLPYPDGFVAYSDYDAQQLARTIFGRISPYLREARECMSVADFVRFARSSRDVHNPPIARTVGYGEVLLGNMDTAVELLQTAVEGLSEQEADECAEVARLVETNPDQARLRIEQFAFARARDLGVASEG